MTIIAPRRAVVIDAIEFDATQGEEAVQVEDLLIGQEDAEKVGERKKQKGRGDWIC